jgi:X-Pro dipeptidyl-peptidase
MKVLIAFSLLLISVFAIKISFSKTIDNSPQPVFRKGEAQVVRAFSDKKTWIYEELWVETDFDSDRDGKPDRMHVYVTRPPQTESGTLQLPVIYNSSPYFGLKLWSMLGIGYKRISYDLNHELGEDAKSRKQGNKGTRTKRPLTSKMMDRQWVPRGYIIVYSSSPGTGLSDGVPTIGGENESLAPKAVIDWLCGRAKGYKTRTGNEEVKAFWSSGKVGMTGTSYDGTLCIAAATTGVEGLEAIIPIAPVTSFYHYYRSNGLVRAPEGYYGEDMDVLYDFVNTGDKKKRKANNRFMRDSVLLLGMDRRSGDYNDFWVSRDYLLKINNMKAAMLMAHAFNDWNVMPEHSFRFYKAAKDLGLPIQLYYHQGGHGGEPPFEMMNRWFTRYLHGVENQVENDAPVQIVREYERLPTAYRNYPDANAADVTFFVSSKGGNSGELVLEAASSNDKLSFTDNYKLEGKKLVQDAYQAHRLLFLSPVLERDIRISGTPRITLKLSSSKAAANLSVWLVTLPWVEGKRIPIYENVITRAWADPQNYKSLTKGEPLKVGDFYELSFDLQPDDQVIRAGKQIALMIFSSDKEFTIWPNPGTQLSVDLKATSITIPIVGGVEAYTKAVTNH